MGNSGDPTSTQRLLLAELPTLYSKKESLGIFDIGSHLNFKHLNFQNQS